MRAETFVGQLVLALRREIPAATTARRRPEFVRQLAGALSRGRQDIIVADAAAPVWDGRRTDAPGHGAPRGRRVWIGQATAVAAAVAVALAATAFAVARFSPLSGRPVSGLVSSERLAFFADARVRAALGAHGVDVRAYGQGARPVEQLTSYDFAFTSGDELAAKLIYDLNRRGTTAERYAVSRSPLVVATFRPIADLLARVGIARQDAAGAWILDFAAYLDLVRSGRRWDEIAGSTAYPESHKILITTADPLTSSSAAMYAVLAAFVLNGGSVPVTAGDADRLAPRVAPLFEGQGVLDPSSAASFDRYLTTGPAGVPMTVTYESNYLARQIAGDGTIRPDMVLMYPSPLLATNDYVIATSARGDRVGELLTSDPRLRQLEAEYGWRVPELSQVLAARHITIPLDPSLAELPPYAVLGRLIAEARGVDPPPSEPAADGPPLWAIS